MTARKSTSKADALFNELLKQGGQRLKIRGRADIYERKGSKLEQINTYGSQPLTRALLSSRIRLSDYLRGVGNVYGASVEEVRIGPSGEFLADKVDGGQSAGGGITPHLVAVGERVTIANKALVSLPLIRHRVKAKNDVGPHKPIQFIDLMHSVCVEGIDLTQVALSNGWWVRRQIEEEPAKIVIPKKQSEKLKAALVDGLETIDEAWSDANIEISRFIEGLEIG